VKNKYSIIAVVVVILLVLGIGGFMFVNHNLSQGQSDDQTQFQDEDAIKLSPKDIGLQMIASSNKKQVKFVINKPQGFTKVEYEISYMADSAGGNSDEDEGDMPAKINRGVAGDDQISPNESKYESKFLDLGSCSSGTCRYDTGVESVHLLLKLTKSDGKLYQVEDDLSLK
jgi:hypothetical protein